MTREDRINALISLDEKINSELFALQNSLKDISELVPDEERYNQYLSRISYIQTLFDRASEIIRGIDFTDPDMDFYDALQAKNRISNNYVRFNRMKNQINRIFDKDRQSDKDGPVRELQQTQQEVSDASDGEEKSEEEPEEVQEDFVPEELLQEEEEKTKRKKRPVPRKSDSDSFKDLYGDEQQRYREAEEYYRNQGDAPVIPSGPIPGAVYPGSGYDNKGGSSIPGNENVLPSDNVSNSYQSTDNASDYTDTYSSDYSSERPEKPVTAADLRDEQYRQEEKRAAEREDKRARREEMHDRFTAYQEEHRAAGAQQAEPRPQNNASSYAAPQNQYSNERPEKPVSAADLRDQQYREEEKRAAEREQIKERRQEKHDRFVAYQEEKRPPGAQSSNNVSQDSKSYNDSPRSYSSTPQSEKPTTSSGARNEQYPGKDNQPDYRPAEREQMQKPDVRDKYSMYQGVSRPAMEQPSKPGPQINVPPYSVPRNFGSNPQPEKPAVATNVRNEQYGSKDKYPRYQGVSQAPGMQSPKPSSQNNNPTYNTPRSHVSTQQPGQPVIASNEGNNQRKENGNRFSEHGPMQLRKQEMRESFTAKSDKSDNFKVRSINRTAFGEPVRYKLSGNQSSFAPGRPGTGGLQGRNNQGNERISVSMQSPQSARGNGGNQPKQDAYTFIPSGIARVNPSSVRSKSQPGNGSFQGIPVRSRDKVKSPEKVSSSSGSIKTIASNVPKSTGSGFGRNGEMPRREFTQFGYTPAGVVANTVVNGVLGRNHTTYKKLKVSASSVRTLNGVPFERSSGVKKGPGQSSVRHNGKSSVNSEVKKQVPMPGTGTGTGAGGNNNSRRPEPRRPYEPFGTTGQTKRGNANKTKKTTVQEPGANVLKKNSHLRTREIAKTYGKAMGGSLVRYAGAAGSMALRKVYQMMQDGDNNALRGFENTRYYGMAAVGTAKALANRRTLINSKRTAQVLSRKERSQFRKFSKMNGKDVSGEINRTRQRCGTLKNEIRDLTNKGSALTAAERSELARKMKEHKALNKHLRKAQKYQSVHRQHAAQVKAEKAFEKRAKGRRVTARAIDRELKAQQLAAVEAMKKKFGNLVNLSDAELAREIKALKEQGKSLKSQIKALQAKGSALTAAERKTLQKLMKKHKALSLRLRKLIGLQNARAELEQLKKIAADAKKKLGKNSRLIKSGLFALQRALMSPLYKSDELGVQGIAKAINISTNHYVHSFVKGSLKASWRISKFGVKAPVKIAKGSYRVGKEAVKAAKAAPGAVKKAHSLVKTGYTAGKKAAHLAPKKVKTLVSSAKKVLTKPNAAGAKKVFQAAGNGIKAAASAAKNGVMALGKLANPVTLKVLAILAAVAVVVVLINGLLSSLTGAGGSAMSVVLTPNTSEDGKLDLSAYYDIVLDEWNDYIEYLNKKGKTAGASKVIVNMEAIPGNTREILTMMAVRMSQDLDLEENGEIEPYLRYLVRQLNPFSKTEEEYYCVGGCVYKTYPDGHTEKFCPGHLKITYNVTSLRFGAEDQLDDLIFSADEMSNEGQTAIAGGLLGKFMISYYCACEECCGKAPSHPDYGKTATGTKVTEGRTIAVDPSVIKLGSHVFIDGHEYVAEDKGGAIKGNRIDIYIASHDEANSKGVRTNVPVYAVGYEGEDIETAGEWQGWNDGNKQWAKTIYYQDWGDIYSGIPMTGGVGGGTTDLSGVEFVDGERPGFQKIVDIAKAEEGYTEGYKFYKWFGFDGHVWWCATFVSWCANEAGVLGSAVPKFAHCSIQGIPWFQSKGQWARPGDITPVAGDIIFFDWEQNGEADHVGIVIGSDGKNVYTIEGNSGVAPGVVRTRTYSLSSACIFGYGLPNY